MRRGAVSKALGLLFLAGLLGTQACDRGAPSAELEQSDSASGVSSPVATVGTEIISAWQLESLMAQQGLSAVLALEQLVNEAVLFQAARQAGIEETPQDRREIERLMVRAMLSDFEHELSPQSITEEEVRKAFEEHRDKMRVLEKRGSMHVLVRDHGPEAKKLAEQVLREFRRGDPKAVLARYTEQEASAQKELQVIAEELPALSIKAGIDEAYKNALFEAAGTGPLPSPVETAYGWHAIVLTEIVPGSEPTLRESEEQLREWLAQSKRQQHLVRLVGSLEETLLQRNEPVVRKLTQAERLPDVSASR